MGTVIAAGVAVELPDDFVADLAQVVYSELLGKRRDFTLQINHNGLTRLLPLHAAAPPAFTFTRGVAMSMRRRAELRLALDRANGTLLLVSDDVIEGPFDDLTENDPRLFGEG